LRFDLKKKKEVEPKLGEIKRIVITSSLVKAYLLNMGKAFLLIGALGGVVYALPFIVGANPFVEVFETIGIPVIWLTRSTIALIAAFLVTIFFTTLGMSSYKLVFEGDTLTYSYGSFIKVTKSTSISNIIGVNFYEYSPLKVGDLMIEFTDTREGILTIPYINKAKYQCDLINKLMTFKRIEREDEIREKGVV